jgi:porphobilinogen synthase
LFGLPEKKDPQGSEAWSDDSAVAEAVRQIKKATPDLIVITDVCLCAYTDHGHCGVLKNNTLDNDPTCELLAKMALAHARAGADIVAPSDMMDGRVAAIRSALDENDFTDIAIMSYAAKFASAFYGPFRDAAKSAPAFGDRKGADIVMVKPALPYLDIITRAKQRFDLPIAAYNVSGEYMMVNSAAAAGLVNGKECMLEVLTAIKRAGADIIITYFAKDAVPLLK